MPVRTYKGVRLGTADEAGKLCITQQSPHGVPAATFRKMPSMPDPWIDPATKLPSRDPERGMYEWDLDEVERRNAARGRRAWTTLERRTDFRHAVLRGISEGVVVWDVGSRLAVVNGPITGFADELKQRVVARVVNDLAEASMITGGSAAAPTWKRGQRPAPGTKLVRWRLTPSGRRLLARWDDERNAA